MYSCMKQAEEVLKVLKKKLPKTSKNSDGICYQPFQNGREHGFSIRNLDTRMQVCFAENRNSDDIVVYYGETYKTFDINNLPQTDEDWARKKYFEPEAYEKAAEFILEYVGHPVAVSMV